MQFLSDTSRLAPTGPVNAASSVTLPVNVTLAQEFTAEPQVALANLAPVGVDELDSYMYQTVGHEVVELIAEVGGKAQVCTSAKSC